MGGQIGWSAARRLPTWGVNQLRATCCILCHFSVFFCQERGHLLALTWHLLSIVEAPRSKSVDPIVQAQHSLSLPWPEIYPNRFTSWHPQIVCCVTAAFSVALFAIPASMLTWGFEAEAERLMVQQHLRQVERAKRVAKVPGGSHCPTSAAAAAGAGPRAATKAGTRDWGYC